VQADLKAKIPAEWLLPEATTMLSSKLRNVLPLFRSCGILTERELEITEAEDAVAILGRIHARTWSAEEVAVAFCKRAAIAQQLVNCLMDIDFEGGIRRAKQLDRHLATTGAVVGPLHGLPVSLKVGAHAPHPWILFLN
jgi:amidase